MGDGKELRPNARCLLVGQVANPVPPLPNWTHSPRFLLLSLSSLFINLTFFFFLFQIQSPFKCLFCFFFGYIDDGQFVWPFRLDQLKQNKHLYIQRTHFSFFLSNTKLRQTWLYIYIMILLIQSSFVIRYYYLLFLRYPPKVLLQPSLDNQNTPISQVYN